MKKADRAFGLYLKDYKLEDIAKRCDVSIGTVKSWMSRNEWKRRKDGCLNEDGTVNKEILAQFAKENGVSTLFNDSPIMDKAASLYESPRDQETAVFVSRTVHNALRFFYNTPPETDTELQQRLFEYFTICQDEGIPPTMEGLWLSLGISKDTFYEWIHGKSGTVRADLCLKAHSTIKECDAQMAIAGKMPQVLYIFRSKNFHAMKDVVENVVTHQHDDSASVEDIASRINDQLPVEDADYSEIDIPNDPL